MMLNISNITIFEYKYSLLIGAILERVHFFDSRFKFISLVLYGTAHNINEKFES